MNGNIWIFMPDDIQITILVDSDQQLTTQLTMLDGKKVVITAVYAKCDAGRGHTCGMIFTHLVMI